MGMRGAGVSTQMNFISEKYQIKTLNIKNDLLALLEVKKNERKRQRFLLRGFKAKEITDENEEAEADPEIENDPEDFDRKNCEEECVKCILEPSTQGLYDANWFDVEEEKIVTGQVDLLADSRRLPELLFVLKLDRDILASRLVDETKIKKEYDTLVQQRKDEKAAEQARIKAEKLEAGEEYEPPEEDEEDPEAPVYEDMLAK